MCDVNLASGEVSQFSVDVMLPGIIPFHFIRQYASGSAAAAGDLGHGWSHNLDTRVRLIEGRAQLVYDGGRTIELEVPKEGHTHDDDKTGVSVSLTPYAIVVTEADQNRYVFPRPTRQVRELPASRREDAYGNALEFSYDDETRLTRLVDTAGRTLTLARDGRGRITEVRIRPAPDAPDARVLARYEYDAAGDLVAAADATGVPYRYGYHEHLLVRVTNRVGGNLYYQYDRGGACVRTWRDGGVQFREIRRTDDRRTVVVLDSRGRRALYRMNEHGMTEEEVDPLGRAKRNVFDPGGKLLLNNSESGGLQEVTRFDAEKRTLTICTNSGQTTIVLDGRGRPAVVTDPAGRTSRTEYDKGGNVTRTVSPTGAEWRFFYDERGYLVGALDPRGYEVRKARSAGGAVTVSDDFGVIYRSYGDLLGNPVVLEDGLGNQTRLEYDPAGRVTKVTYPHGATSSYAYDAEGSLVRATDETGLVTQYRYDPNGSLLEQVEPDGRSIKFTYDTEENLTGVVNAAGERAEFGYDAVGREHRIVYFDGTVEDLEYDERDQVVAVRDGAGRLRSQYAYDDAGRVVRVRWADGRETTVTYGNTCEIVAIDGPDVPVRYEWDGDLRIVKEQVGDAVVEYEYDASGNRTALATGDGRRITYEWDLRSRLKRMVDSGKYAYEYDYNVLNLATACRMPNALVQRFEYDRANRMSRRWVEDPNGRRAVTDRRWEYDAAGRLVRADDLQRGISAYRYDVAEHLVEATTPAEVERYPYDARENLVSTRAGEPVVVTAGDRLRSVGQELWVYDDWGNPVERRAGRDVTRYAYAHNGQLARVEHPSGDTTEYRYDPLGRRVAKMNGGAATAFQWDGVAPLSETSPAGKADYLFLPGSFFPVGVTRGGEHYSYSFDQIATPTEMFDARRGIAWAADFTAFGEVRSLLAAAVPNPIRFQGQYFDDELGLCYNRHRYYDPRVNRFLTPDPIGFSGGVSLYRYVPNPINWVDPFGLVVCEVLFKCSWSKNQKKEAQKKVDALNEQIGNGRKIPDEVPSACAARKNAKKIYEECKTNGHKMKPLTETGSKCSNQQADHIREVCLGGKETDCKNLQPLNQSVNASFGSQMANCAKKNAGKMLTGIKVKPGCRPGGKKCPDV